MQIVRSMGFPKMHKEESEKRDFLPGFFCDLASYNTEIILEKGYGERLGFTEKDYIACNKSIRFAEPEDVYKCDMIIVLRCPEVEEINLIERGSILISMLHYETRETRNLLFKEKGINCFSMDAMTNDQNERILVNYKGTSRAGSRIAFEELKRRTENFSLLDKDVVKVSIIGAGAVAANSAKAFEEFGDNEFLGSEKGLIIQMLPRTITQNESFLSNILKDTDILVDASKRPDPSKYIIKNSLLERLPKHSIILDLSADPYNTSIEPIQVKGVEGIPTGSLDKYVIEPDDYMYTEVPKKVESQARRVVVSCNAWPGVDAKDCMELYGKQLLPFIDVLLSKGLDELDMNSRNMYERSLVRSSLDHYFEHNKNKR